MDEVGGQGSCQDVLTNERALRLALSQTRASDIWGQIAWPFHWRHRLHTQRSRPQEWRKRSWRTRTGQGYSLEDTRSIAQSSEDVDGVALVRIDDGALDVLVDLGLLGAHEASAHCEFEKEAKDSVSRVCTNADL